MRTISVKAVGKTTVELRIEDTTETLEFLEAIELACDLAMAHANLAKTQNRSIKFGYGTISTGLSGKEIFDLSLTLQIAAIPLGKDSLDGGWESKPGRELLNRLETGAPTMAMAESIRASRDALNDLGSMTGKEHLAADDLYRRFKQVVDSLKSKKSVNGELDGALLDACQKGQLDSVRDLLAKGANVDAKGSFGVTCLIKAISLGQIEVAKELLAQGADVDARNNNGETALLHAAQSGHVELVKDLLALGADVNAKGNIGGTALMQASYYGKVDVVNALITGGAKIDAKNVDGTSALFMAAMNCKFEVVKALLIQGADANTTMTDGWNALMKASQDGHLEVVEELLSHGADLNARNAGGNTPLMISSFKGRYSVVKELIARGADLNARSNNGDTALKLAGSEEVRTLLLNAGAKAHAGS